MSLKLFPTKVGQIVRVLRPQPLTTARDVMSPHDALLRRWLPSDLTRGPVAAFAAHASVRRSSEKHRGCVCQSGAVNIEPMTDAPAPSGAAPK